MLPFSLSELSQIKNDTVSLDALIHRGGFPEPLLAKDDDEAQRWRKNYIDGLIRDDVLNYDSITHLHKLRLLIELLQRRVGSPLSMESLREDLDLHPQKLRLFVI